MEKLLITEEKHHLMTTMGSKEGGTQRINSISTIIINFANIDGNFYVCIDDDDSLQTGARANSFVCTSVDRMNY